MNHTRFLVCVLTSSKIELLDRLINNVHDQKKWKKDEKEDWEYELVIIVNTLNDMYYDTVMNVYGKKGINVVRTESNGYPGKGHNSCIDYFGSRSNDFDYMFMIDGDDMIYPYALSSLYDHIQQEPKPDIIHLMSNDKVIHDLDNKLLHGYRIKDNIVLLSNNGGSNLWESIHLENTNPYYIGISKSTTPSRILLWSNRIFMKDMDKRLISYHEDMHLFDDITAHVDVYHCQEKGLLNTIVINDTNIYCYNGLNDDSTTYKFNEYEREDKIFHDWIDEKYNGLPYKGFMYMDFIKGFPFSKKGKELRYSIDDKIEFCKRNTYDLYKFNHLERARDTSKPIEIRNTYYNKLINELGCDDDISYLECIEFLVTSGINQTIPIYYITNMLHKYPYMIPYLKKMYTLYKSNSNSSSRYIYYDELLKRILNDDNHVIMTQRKKERGDHDNKTYFYIGPRPLTEDIINIMTKDSIIVSNNKESIPKGIHVMDPHEFNWMMKGNTHDFNLVIIDYIGIVFDVDISKIKNVIFMMTGFTPYDKYHTINGSNSQSCDIPSSGIVLFNNTLPLINKIVFNSHVNKNKYRRSNMSNKDIPCEVIGYCCNDDDGDDMKEEEHERIPNSFVYFYDKGGEYEVMNKVQHIRPIDKLMVFIEILRKVSCPITLHVIGMNEDIDLPSWVIMGHESLLNQYEYILDPVTFNDCIKCMKHGIKIISSASSSSSIINEIVGQGLIPIPSTKVSITEYLSHLLTKFIEHPSLSESISRYNKDRYSSTYRSSIIKSKWMEILL